MSWASNWRVLEAGAAWSLVARRKSKVEMVKAFIVDALRYAVGEMVVLLYEKEGC